MYVVAQLLSGIAVTSKISLSTELSTLIGASEAFQILSNVGLVSTAYVNRLWMWLVSLCYIFFSAIVGASVTQYFFLLGIQYTSATFACAFINMVPVITFIMALPFGLESVNIKCKSGRAKILGTLVCIGGALLLTLYKGKPLFNYASATSIEKSGTSSSSGRWIIGVVALIIGTLFWSSWYIVQLSISKRFPCQYSSCQAQP
ncbi:WAT1-related protein At3g30340-like [Arachis stenosperma]|uniref:WAT1-related protein At3g30340-like n=1 Tax=Arachis stenosperma TaxID=217475 RepID=UPI0025AD4735|nr:WAT1-related protein At3g30340-like [Arachis stenosperma]